MIIEKFKPGKIAEVYTRFAARGRMAPDDLRYISSWITDDLSTCYQVMETENYASLEQWMANWKDLTDFEVKPVVTSQEAKEKILA
jgi:hypothetical protein